MGAVYFLAFASSGFTGHPAFDKIDVQKIFIYIGNIFIICGILYSGI